MDTLGEDDLCISPGRVISEELTIKRVIDTLRRRYYKCQKLLRPAKKRKTGSNNKLVFVKNVNGLTCQAEKIAWKKKPEHDRRVKL